MARLITLAPRAGGRVARKGTKVWLARRAYQRLGAGGRRRGGRRGRLLLAGGAGAAAAYLLDPADGARRRSVARDRVLSFIRRGGEEAQRKADYAGGVATGVAHRAAQATSGADEAKPQPDDVTLARKVESIIFRDDDAPKGQVSVNAEHGVVYLRGEVEGPDQIKALGLAAGTVDGVRGVENLLHRPGTPAPTKQS
jgi:osmotically-inducible protein OsmY